MNILDKLVNATEERVSRAKAKTPLFDFSGKEISKVFPFEKALNKEGMSFICEIKKASPSKGLISPEFPYLEIAHQYEEAKADAISVLTEPDYFLGSIEYLKEVVSAVNLPVIQKDFIIDSWQILQSRYIGASAVLLIVGILSPGQLKEYIEIAHENGLSCLVEAHDEKEVETAVSAAARIVGVNNRNLKDFTVNFDNSINLRKCAPADLTFVAESGIKTAEDISLLRKNGIDAVLIGETLMRSDDKKKMLTELRGD